MALTNKYTVVTGKMADLFAKIRDGQAPEQLNRQLLKGLGIQILKRSRIYPLT